MRERTLQTTPLATTVRPWAPGDAFNRIHWKSTARHIDIQVKEFDLEQTADAWIVLDLDRSVHVGTGDESTVEAAIRVAAAVTDTAIQENRAVGATVASHRLSQLPPDRGSRQRLKIMQLLAAVDGDGSTPLSETLVAVVPRIRRGMTAVVVSPSLDRTWVKPLSALRARGVACVVVTFDVGAFARFEAVEARLRKGLPPDPEAVEEDEAEVAARGQATRALRHALAEFDVKVHTIVPARPLGELLVG
jgi:uncharacterized protein (DUF58 family)